MLVCKAAPWRRPSIALTEGLDGKGYWDFSKIRPEVWSGRTDSTCPVCAKQPDGQMGKSFNIKPSTKAGISCGSRAILSAGGRAAMAARYEENDGYAT